MSAVLSLFFHSELKFGLKQPISLSCGFMAAGVMRRDQAQVTALTRRVRPYCALPETPQF